MVAVDTPHPLFLRFPRWYEPDGSPRRNPDGSPGITILSDDPAAHPTVGGPDYPRPTWWKEYNGKFSEPEAIDRPLIYRMSGYGSQVTGELEPENTIATARRTSAGRWIDDFSDLPKVFRITSQHKVMPDMVHTGSRFIVSEKMCDLLQEMTVTKQQFLPITVITKRGEEVAGPYFQWNCLTLIDAVIPEKTQCVIKENDPNSRYPLNPDLRDPRKYKIDFRNSFIFYTFSNQKVAGNHIFQTIYSANQTFVDEVFLKEIKERRVKGGGVFPSLRYS